MHLPNDQNFSEGIQQLEQGCAFAAIIASAEGSVLFRKKNGVSHSACVS